METTTCMMNTKIFFKRNLSDNRNFRPTSHQAVGCSWGRKYNLKDFTKWMASGKRAAIKGSLNRNDFYYCLMGHQLNQGIGRHLQRWHIELEIGIQEGLVKKINLKANVTGLLSPGLTQDLMYYTSSLLLLLLPFLLYSHLKYIILFLVSFCFSKVN